MVWPTWKVTNCGLGRTAKQRKRGHLPCSNRAAAASKASEGREGGTDAGDDDIETRKCQAHVQNHLKTQVDKEIKMNNIYCSLMGGEAYPQFISAARCAKDLFERWTSCSNLGDHHDWISPARHAWAVDACALVFTKKLSKRIQPASRGQAEAFGRAGSSVVDALLEFMRPSAMRHAYGLHEGDDHDGGDQSG